MKNSKYWAKRAEEIAQIQYDKADELCRKIVKEYQKADKYITERINLYYARYADEYGVTLADSKKILSTSELRNFKMSLEEFREKALNNEDDKWTKELDEEYLRSRISRLDALKFEINNKINELSGKHTKDATRHLKEVFEDTYSKTVTIFGENFGIGNNFAPVDDKTIEQVIYSRWTNQDNFAGRISTNKAALLSSLNKTITQGLIVGLSSDDMVKKLMKETKISRNRAINLIQTETTFIIGQANTKMYKDFGVKQYEVIETLDSSTCETCAEMDGKRFKVSEKQEGLNSPPFHPRCRGTTVPVSKYEHIWGESDRIARDDEGNTYYINGKGEIVYKEHLKNKTVNILRQNYFTDDTGKQYDVDGKNVVLKPSEKEIEVARILARIYEADVNLIPVVLNPTGVKTPDYIINGQKYDLKEIFGDSSKTLYNALKKKSKQADNFIFDITESEIKEEEAMEQIELIYKSMHRTWVQEIVLIKNNKVIKKYKRK